MTEDTKRAAPLLEARNIAVSFAGRQGMIAGLLVIAARHFDQPRFIRIGIKPGYFLLGCIQQAAGNLRPARIGWSSEDHPEGTHCRVFIRRPDCLDMDPLGRRNVRAMMHPGHQNPQFMPFRIDLEQLHLRELVFLYKIIEGDHLHIRCDGPTSVKHRNDILVDGGVDRPRGCFIVIKGYRLRAISTADIPR